MNESLDKLVKTVENGLNTINEYNETNIDLREINNALSEVYIHYNHEGVSEYESKEAIFEGLDLEKDEFDVYVNLGKAKKLGKHVKKALSVMSSYSSDLEIVKKQKLLNNALKEVRFKSNKEYFVQVSRDTMSELVYRDQNMIVDMVEEETNNYSVNTWSKIKNTCNKSGQYIGMSIANNVTKRTNRREQDYFAKIIGEYEKAGPKDIVNVLSVKEDSIAYCVNGISTKSVNRADLQDAAAKYKHKQHVAEFNKNRFGNIAFALVLGCFIPK